MKKYRTIVADPAWDIDFSSGWGMTKEKQYDTVNIDFLKNLPIENISEHESCNLFLWTTHTRLEDALMLMKHWGFKFHVAITWNKGHGLHAHGFFRQTELCLYGFKGKMNFSKNGKACKTYIEEIPDLFYSRSNGHSRKPEYLFDIIDKKAEGNKIELFARTKRSGWDAWGNEVNSDVDLSVFV